jgi:peptidyl-prolyl cis-trans isomerase D
MATIGKIRQRSGLVIALIGLAMLGFIATDLITNNRLFRSNGSSIPEGIGKAYNQQLDINEFREKLAMALNRQYESTGGQQLSETQMQQTSDQIWKDFIDQKILEKEYNALGLQVTGEEMIDLCAGANPHPLAMQYLSQNGQFNRGAILNYIKTVHDKPAKEQENWAEFSEYLYNIRLKEKYDALIKGSVFVTDLEVAEDFEAKNQMATIQYVPLMLNSIQDTTVKVSDAEMKDYYDKHKEDYKRQESRSLQYVAFDIVPTSEDTADAQKRVADQVETLKTKGDSNYLNLQRADFTNQYMPHGSFPEAFDDAIFKADSGAVIGPIYENGTYRIAKVLSFKKDTTPSYHASHILIKPKAPTHADTLEARAKARRLMAMAEKGADFATLAKDSSEDRGSAIKGGDVGWFKKGRMFEPFYKAVAGASKGQIVMTESQAGIHVVKILDEPSDKLAKAGIISHEIVALPKTQHAISAQADEFTSKVTNPDDFEKVAKSLGLNLFVADKVLPNQHDIPGLTDANDLIHWLYEPDAAVGAIYPTRKIDNKFVVAKITKIEAEGYTPLDEIKTQVKALVRLEKKKDMLADKLKKAMDQNKDNLDAIAKEVQSTVSNADAVNFSTAFIPGFSSEPPLVGAVFGMKPGTIRGPIKGDNGVYVVKLISATKVDVPKNLDNQRRGLEEQVKGTAEMLATQALQKKADPKDYRYLHPINELMQQR